MAEQAAEQETEQAAEQVAEQMAEQMAGRQSEERRDEWSHVSSARGVRALLAQQQAARERHHLPCAWT